MKALTKKQKQITAVSAGLAVVAVITGIVIKLVIRDK